MKRIILASTALALFAVPAQAQLLGGGLGGSLGGSVGGVLNGTVGRSLPIPSTRSLPTTVTNTTRGSAEASGGARGSSRVDRRRGSVEANGSGSGSIVSGVAGTLGSPLATSSGSGSAAASGSGSGSASAHVIGTDAVRSIAGSVYGQGSAAGRAAIQHGQGALSGVVGTAGSLAGSVQAAGSGSASGGSSFGSGLLAASGSLAAEGQGAFTVEKGTPIFDLSGDKIGSVRDVMADGRGRIEQLLVKVDGERALLPAGYFQVSGEALVSAMSEAQIKQIADQQEAAR